MVEYSGQSAHTQRVAYSKMPRVAIDLPTAPACVQRAVLAGFEVHSIRPLRRVAMRIIRDKQGHKNHPTRLNNAGARLFH
jgi:hypothetical protein